MWKKIKAYLFPTLTPREQEVCDAVKRLESNGVNVIITDRGAVRLEFTTDESRKWYFKETFDKFKEKKNER